MVTHEERYPGMSEEELNLIITVLNLYAGGFHPRDDVGFEIISPQARKLASKLRRMPKAHDEIDPTGFGLAFRQLRRKQ